MVTINQVAKAGELLAEVVSAGANELLGIEFQLADREGLLARARAAAIADARRSAEHYAKAARASVGEVLTIVEQGGAIPPGQFTPTAAEAAAVPIVPGEQTVTAAVQVMFALEER